MPIPSILVPICPDVEFDHQLDAALSLARGVEGHINAVYIRPDPVIAAAAIPEAMLAAGITADRIEREGREAEAGARAKFEAWRGEHRLACGIVDQSLRTPFACWSEVVGGLEATIVRRGRLSDLIVLNRPDSSEVATGMAFDAAVFDTARPTILLPKNRVDRLLPRIVVAWNGTIEATRAVAGAMPLLHAAERVFVFAAPSHRDDSSEGLDLAEFLSWHGIRAECSGPVAEDGSVGAALLRFAAQRGATMLVMGGYTHSRVRQMFLGGVTSHVLNHAELPVLMTH